MITKPPPNDSAPTFKATQASAPRPPVATTANGDTTNACGPRGPRIPPETATSTRPHPNKTSTSQVPTVAAATPPATAYTTQRTWRARTSPARRQLAGSSPSAALIATGATAAPAPKAAPLIQVGGLEA